MYSLEYLKLKSHIHAKNLKNGELLLLDTKTGIWLKTSFSFKKLYNIIKEGTTMNEVKKVITTLYPGRENEAEICLDSLRINGFLEGFESTILQPLNEIRPIRIICDFSANKKLLREFLLKNFENIPIELVYEYNNHINKDKIKVDYPNVYPSNIELVFRVDWNMLRKETIDEFDNNISNISTIQINFNDFESDQDKINEKRRLIEFIIKEKKVELRYAIAAFYKKRKKEKDLTLPLILMPHVSYYFTGEEIFHFHNGKDRYKYFIFWVKTMNKFYQLFSMGAKALVKFSSGNLLPMIVFSRILKDSCGAGITNFYIDKNGNIYPCKYLDKFPMGNINSSSLIFFNKYSYTRYPTCNECPLLRVCSRLCLALHQEGFSKICKFYKGFLIAYISAIPIKAIKELSRIEGKSNDSEFKSFSKAKEEVKRFNRRCLCPIGTF
ncbi:MAG: SPASM domain-containing protein [candidate division WOR-3 bacterium]